MARTPAQTAALVKKAVASENKSEGMRNLFDAGMTASEISEAFDAPYGYVYGVGVRHGAITPTARTAKAATPKAAAKTPARSTTKATGKASTARPARAAKPAAKAASKTKARAKA